MTRPPLAELQGALAAGIVWKAVDELPKGWLHGIGVEFTLARVLVVDDDDRVLKSVERVLTSAGHEVHTEAHGSISLDMATSQPLMWTC